MCKYDLILITGTARFIWFLNNLYTFTCNRIRFCIRLNGWIRSRLKKTFMRIIGTGFQHVQKQIVYKAFLMQFFTPNIVLRHPSSHDLKFNDNLITCSGELDTYRYTCFNTIQCFKSGCVWVRNCMYRIVVLSVSVRIRFKWYQFSLILSLVGLFRDFYYM
jgi:hypothetical protein